MASGATSRVSKLQSFNPATGELLAEFDPATEAEVQAAVARAGEARAAWRRLTIDERVQYLLRLKGILYTRREELAALITREAGKPAVESLLAEVIVVIDALAYFARNTARFLRPERVGHHNPALKLKRGRIEYQPYGVIGIISPANYPFSIPWSGMIPALAAGNTVVLKPSELTPQVGLAIRDLLEEAKFPPGVATVVLGDEDAGGALVRAPVDKLIFTGSVITGKKIQAAAASRLLPTLLELGGKDPMIVCADADLEQASSGAIWGAFTNAGQACLSVERLYVVDSVAQEFTRLCVEKTRKLRVGRGDDPSTDVGPLIRDQQVQKVEDQVAEAVSQGAQILAGGRRPPGTRGFFYEPTVITRVHQGMRLMREETFGPVLPIVAVENEGQAVRLANDSDFGLGASVWTRDLERGERLAQQLEAGAVMVNDCLSYYAMCEAPHGGVKASGFGRTHSRLGLLETVRVQYLDVDLVPKLRKLWWFSYGSKTSGLVKGLGDFLFGPGLAQRAKGLATVLASLRKRFI